MAETVGVLNVEIRGKADALDRDLRRAEAMAKASAGRLEKDLQNTLSVGKFAAGLRVATGVAEAAIHGFGVITAAIAGNFDDILKSTREFESSMKSIPIVGDAFQLGQLIGEGIFQDKADAAKIDAETRRRDAENTRRQKANEDAQKRIRDLTRETALLEASGDPEKAKKLRAQFRFDDAIGGLAAFSPEAQAKIVDLASRRLALESQSQALRGVTHTSSLSATQLANQVTGLSRNEHPVTKKQGDKQIALLTEMLTQLRIRQALVVGP